MSDVGEKMLLELRRIREALKESQPLDLARQLPTAPYPPAVLQ